MIDLNLMATAASSTRKRIFKYAAAICRLEKFSFYDALRCRCGSGFTGGTLIMSFGGFGYSQRI